MAAILIIVFALLTVGLAQEESKKPDYLKEKEQMVKSEKPRPVELEKSDKPTQQYIKAAFVIVREFITDARGIIVPVFHTNSLIIRDTQKNLRDIETIIEHIDVKGKSL